MNLYIATRWDGSSWVDLHTEPKSYKDASQMSYAELLTNKGTTRLRVAVGGCRFRCHLQQAT